VLLRHRHSPPLDSTGSQQVVSKYRAVLWESLDDSRKSRGRTSFGRVAGMSTKVTPEWKAVSGALLLGLRSRRSGGKEDQRNYDAVDVYP